MTFTDDKAFTINDLIGAVIAIETELGSLPAGDYASVRTRLDILEARINNPFAPAPNVDNPFYIGGSPVSGVSIQDGYGDPNTLNVPAIPGSLYLREDGTDLQGLYSFRSDGYWQQIAGSGGSGNFSPGGDLSGSNTNQAVIGIQGRPISGTAPDDGYALVWNGSNWAPAAVSGSFTAAQDLSGSSSSQTVVGIQGRPISGTTPDDGYALIWNGSEWAPGIVASGFTAANDLSGSSTSQTVVGIQGIPVLGSPTTGEYLYYNGSNWATNTILDTMYRINNADIPITNTISSIVAGFLGLTADRTGTLPASPTNGQRITFKDKDGSLGSFNFVIAGNGTNIDGASSYTMTNANVGPYGAVTVAYDGTDWGIISQFEAPPFVPTQLADLLMWQRADLGITIETGVSSWLDQSGNGNNLSQANTLYQPGFNASDATYNNHPVLLFTQTGETQLSINPISPSTAANVTVFFVGETDHSVYQFFFEFVGAGAIAFYYNGDNNFYALGGGGASEFPANTSAGSTPSVFGTLFNGASSAIYLNAKTPLATGNAGTAIGQTQGWLSGTDLAPNGSGFNGKMAEFIFYNRALTTSEINQVLAYIGARYNIAIGS